MSLLILSIIFTMGVVSASEDMNNTFVCINEINDDSISVDNSFDGIIPTESSNDDLSDENDYVIYVGNKNSTEEGNGSYENPFSTLNNAHSNIKEYKKSITLNIFEGIYYLDSDLRFNTSNLNIQSVSGNVIFKNFDNIKGTSSNPGSQIAFGTLSSNVNFTMNGITFDASDWTLVNGRYNYFAPFVGDNANVTFNNCTFTGYNNKVSILMPECIVNYIFNNCKFIEFENTRNLIPGVKNCEYIFNYCIISAKFSKGIGMSSAERAVFINCWYGQNTDHCLLFYTEKDVLRTNIYELGRFAVFHVTENYLGNNQYEIVGKLMWNDTTDDDIDKLGPMTVTLSSTTGDLPETAILQDGTFRVIYNSTASTHDVTAKLDKEIITLNFNTTDMTVETSDIIIGQDQNITVTLPQDFNGTLSIKVNNKTYESTVNNTKSVTYQIPDVLPAGTHEINVIFADEENHIYGMNSTAITVSKVSDYDFDATVNPTNVYLGDSVSITLSLPGDADGNVSVKVGDNDAKIFDIKDLISINDFVAGNNAVNITYLGNDKYVSKSVVKNVEASLKPTAITGDNVTTTYNVTNDLIVTLKDVDGKVLVNKTVNVVVGTINVNLTTNATGQATVDVSTLTPDTYTAAITFAGDETYAGSNSNASIAVNKVASKITAPAVTATYNVAKKLVITLKDADGKALAKQKVAVKVGTISKTLTTNDKGQVSIDVSKLTPKKYTATFTYAGDDIYSGVSGSAKVTVNKATPKLTAKAAKLKVNTKTKKYTVTLKDNKGKALSKAKVTLKVKGVTYKATTNSKGQATFKITKLTKKGNYNAVIKFAGNSNYKAISKKAKLTVK